MDSVIKIPLYNGRLIVSIRLDLKESFQSHGFKYDNQAKHYDELTFRTSNGEYYMFLKPQTSPGKIASLARKLCRLVFEKERINLSLEQVNHECHLIEWIVDEVYRIQNDTKIKTIYSEN